MERFLKWKAINVSFRDQDLLEEHRDASFAASSGIALRDWLHNLAERVVLGNISRFERNFDDEDVSLEEDEEEPVDEWDDEDDGDDDDDKVTAHFFGADGIANAPGWATLGGF